MTWEIVVGIFALVSAFLAVGGVVFKLSRILAKLESAIRTLDDTLSEYKDANKESHDDIYGRIEEHDKSIHKIDVELTKQDGRLKRLEER